MQLYRFCHCIVRSDVQHSESGKCSSFHQLVQGAILQVVPRLMRLSWAPCHTHCELHEADMLFLVFHLLRMSITFYLSESSFLLMFLPSVAKPPFVSEPFLWSLSVVGSPELLPAPCLLLLGEEASFRQLLGCLGPASGVYVSSGRVLQGWVDPGPLAAAGSLLVLCSCWGLGSGGSRGDWLMPTAPTPVVGAPGW